MNRKIKMKTTAAGPDATFHSEHVYEVGTHINAEQAKAFVDGRYAHYETAEGGKGKETTAAGGSAPADAVQALLAGKPGDIKPGIKALSDADLAWATQVESSTDGKNRSWVLKAIEAETILRAKPAEDDEGEGEDAGDAK